MVVTDEGRKLFETAEFIEHFETVEFLDKYGDRLEKYDLCEGVRVFDSGWVTDGCSSAQVFKVLDGDVAVASILLIQSEVDRSMRMTYDFSGDVLAV